MSGENAKKHSNRAFWDKKMIQGKAGESVPLFARILRRFDLYRSSVYGIIFFVRDNSQVVWKYRIREIWNGHKQHEKKTAPDTGAVI